MTRIKNILTTKFSTRSKIYISLLIVIACVAGISGCRQTRTVSNSELLGADRDRHGCISSAGYTWSEVRNDCIRLFESGIRLNATEGESTAYIVFSNDSAKVELFFSDDSRQPVLSRDKLPNGYSIWKNKDKNNTESVENINGRWAINQQDKITYRQY